MSPPPSAPRARLRALDPRRPRRDSHIVLTVTDGLLGLGAVTLLCAVAGSLDALGDSAVLAGTAVLLIAVALRSRARLVRRRRPAPSAVLSGLAAAWLALVAVGAAVYLVTGTIGRFDDAAVEAAAGFSTTAVTTLDPSELSVPMALWRASTPWVRGAAGGPPPGGGAPRGAPAGSHPVARGARGDPRRGGGAARGTAAETPRPDGVDRQR
ncbi:MAG: hypothetical protein KTV16_05905 [Acidimicrobiia bacterium]|nr:hypothetical protein [Acidimicrobiia bacterium]